MSDPVIIAIIGFLGTIIGSGLGVLASSKLVNYRIGQLEEQVRKHNSIVERTYELEKNEALIEERLEKIEEDLK